jgi:hypothetical protein
VCCSVSTQGVQENFAKTFPKQTVNEEIARRVEHNKSITQLRVVEVKTATGPSIVVQYGPENLIDKSWSLAHDKTDDNNDNAASYVVFFRLMSCQTSFFLLDYF